MFRLMIVMALLVLAGCSPPLGEPLDITLEDYDELPFGSLTGLQKDQYVIYRHHGVKVIGIVANLSRDGNGLIVTPEGDIQNHREERIKIWIYHGDGIYPCILHQENLDRLRQLVPNHQTTGVEE